MSALTGPHGVARAYVQSPICGVSRMSYHTGRYCRSHAATWNGIPLRVGEPTLGDHLRGFDSRNPWEDWANSGEGDDGELLSGWLLRYSNLAARVPNGRTCAAGAGARGRRKASIARRRTSIYRITTCFIRCSSRFHASGA